MSATQNGKTSRSPYFNHLELEVARRSYISSKLNLDIGERDGDLIKLDHPI